MKYDVKSERADEFISDAEIRETMAYAEAHKSDRPLIASILKKARECRGLDHREATVLLVSDQPDFEEEMFALARDIKQRFYGNRIVMLAPLYLSNYCVNGCVYCPYHAKNKTIRRRKLTQDEIRREVIALQDMGHKRLALETGEDHQAQERGHQAGEREHCCHHGGELPEAEGGRHRDVHPVSGDV